MLRDLSKLLPVGGGGKDLVSLKFLLSHGHLL